MPDTLETKAIKRYLQTHPVAHFPVDIDGNLFIDCNRKNAITRMFDLFAGNADYQDLRSQLKQSLQQKGLHF